jgi:peptidoglycan/LPS O-acetylase OafA/YrhL
MTIADPWAFFAINLLCFGLAFAIARASGFYRRELAKVESGRTQMLDGLRGWLALGVFFAHSVTTYAWYTTGSWDGAIAPFYGRTGQIGVSIFFMITGYLFWGRVVRAKGRLDVPSFYLSRVRRIVPMYLFSVAMVLAVVALLSDFALRVAPGELLRELRSWLSFGFMYAGELNGVKDAHNINAVYWTLAYEWMFYLSLPMLALFWRGPGLLVMVVTAFLFCLQTPVTLNFIAGGAAAVLVESRLFRSALAAKWMTPLPLAAIGLVFTYPSAFGLMPSVLMFIFFLFVVHGNSLFGVLATRASKMLGTVSYSIYLVHCIALFVVMRAVDARFPISGLEPLQYWMFAALAAVATVAISALTYRYVEYPFLRANRLPELPPAVVAWIRSMRSARAQASTLPARPD